MRYLVLFALLFACSEPKPPANPEPYKVFTAYGYDWWLDPTVVPCDHYTWTQKDPIAVVGLCGEGKIGCSFFEACHVYSMYDEETAKRVIPYQTGQSHFYHETDMHLRRCLRHPPVIRE